MNTNTTLCTFIQHLKYFFCYYLKPVSNKTYRYPVLLDVCNRVSQSHPIATPRQKATRMVIHICGS